MIRLNKRYNKLHRHFPSHWSDCVMIQIYTTQILNRDLFKKTLLHHFLQPCLSILDFHMRFKFCTVKHIYSKSGLVLPVRSRKSICLTLLVKRVPVKLFKSKPSRDHHEHNHSRTQHHAHNEPRHVQVPISYENKEHKSLQRHPNTKCWSVFCFGFLQNEKNSLSVCAFGCSVKINIKRFKLIFDKKNIRKQLKWCKIKISISGLQYICQQ